MIKKSAGLVLIKGKKILLVKPTNISQNDQWSIPKGYIESSDINIIHTAIRETFEETGVKVPYQRVTKSFHGLISYVNAQGELTKVVFYFVIKFSEDEYMAWKTGTHDSNEVDGIHFFDSIEARKVLYWKQHPVLNHLNDQKFLLSDLNRHIQLGYISKIKHPKFPLWMYNYTQKCKKEKNWNYTTMSCRGLILDDSGKIISRTFLKFFKWDQLYKETKDIVPEPKVFYEKLDGALGIMYWYRDSYYITTKNHFQHILSDVATSILYSEYSFRSLPSNVTHLFEILDPNYTFTLNYSVTKIILIGAVSIEPFDYLPLESYDIDKASLLNYPSNNKIGEGYVAHSGNKFLVKYKEQSFLQNYLRMINIKKKVVDGEVPIVSFLEKDNLVKFESRLLVHIFDLYRTLSIDTDWHTFYKKNIAYFI